MVVVACRPTTAASRSGVAPNTVKELPGAPAKAAVIGRADVGELVHPAQTDREVELALVAEADRAAEIGADGGALRVGGLLRHVEAERLRARTREKAFCVTLEIWKRPNGVMVAAAGA